MYSPANNLLAVLLAGSLFLFGCENDIREVANYGKKQIQVEEGKNIESWMSQTGNVKAVLTAPRLLRYRADTPYTEFPAGLHVDFFKDSLILESVVNAKYGRYIEYSSKVFLRDSVLVYNTKGDTLWCQELWWDQNQQLFYSDKFVKIHTANPRQDHTGTGLRAAQNFSWYTILNNKGVVEMPGDIMP